MSRIWIRGSSMGVRIFAVGVLVVGLVAGLTAGYLNKTGNTLTLKELSSQQKVEAADARAASTNIPQEGARTQKVLQEIAAFEKARAAAKVKAVAAARAAKARAERAAAERASRSKKRAAAGGGEMPPQTPVDCMTLRGHRRTGCSLLSWAGFGTNQMGCLDKLWTKESGWNPKAHNKSSQAHGIPQAFPGKKMAAYGPDWETNAVPQIKWGLMYIKGRYKTPCGAWSHFLSKNWY